MLNLEIWVELESRHYAHDLLHPMKYIPLKFPQYYSLKVLFIAQLSLKILTILLQFELALFIIHIGVNFFLFSKFLPTKVR